MSEYDVVCSFPDCSEALFITWELAASLSPDDLDTDAETNALPPLSSEWAHTQHWRVECAAGHVLLLPGSLGCPCLPEVQGEPNKGCTHNENEWDWSDEWRNFRPHDAERLRTIIFTMRAVANTIQPVESS
jgi:hypothetical protein